jgi:hypothetical protein
MTEPLTAETESKPTMKFLSAVLFGLAIVLGIVLLTPVLTAGLGLALAFGCLFIWLLPILLIAGSDVTTGGEKLAWILAIIFLSWFAWIFYALLAPLKRKPRYLRYDSSRYDYY